VKKTAAVVARNLP